MHSSLQIHHIKQNGIAFHVPHYLSCKTVLSNRIISPLRHHKITELGITHEIPNKLEVSMGQVNSGWGSTQSHQVGEKEMCCLPKRNGYSIDWMSTSSSQTVKTDDGLKKKELCVKKENNILQLYWFFNN